MNYRRYATDIEALCLSAFKEGAYFIITCHCGEPACAGIYTPVHVTHEDAFVKWQTMDPLQEQTLTFKKEDYLFCVYRLLSDYMVITERYRRKFLNADWHIKPSIDWDTQKYLLSMQERLAKLVC